MPPSNSAQPGRDNTSTVPPVPRRSRLLIPLLLTVAAVFLITLPWQRRQWAATRRLQDENALQEARIHDLKSKEGTEVSASASFEDEVHQLLAQGDLNTAGKRLEREEKPLFADPVRAGDAALASRLAGLFQDAGWVDRGLFHAQRANTLAPNDLGTLLHLAVIEAQLGWQKECRIHVEQALKIAPKEAEPHLVMALLHDQVGAFAAAEKELLTADRLRPNDLHIALLLFRNRMDQHHYGDALATAETALRRDPTEPALTACRAEVLIARGMEQVGSVNTTDLQAGLETARRYQQLAPNNKDAHFLIGKALKGLGDTEGALREWETAAEALPNQLELTKSLGLLLCRHGQQERGKKMLAQSVRTEDEIVKYNRLVTVAGLRRANPEDHRALARWCQEHGKLSRAILEWEQTLALRPNDAEAKREWAVCVQQRRDRK